METIEMEQILERHEGKMVSLHCLYEYAGDTCKYHGRAAIIHGKLYTIKVGPRCVEVALLRKVVNMKNVVTVKSYEYEDKIFRSLLSGKRKKGIKEVKLILPVIYQ